MAPLKYYITAFTGGKHRKDELTLDLPKSYGTIYASAMPNVVALLVQLQFHVIKGYAECRTN